MHFEETAWDIALATQSLTYVDPQLAEDVSRVYNRQSRIAELNRGIIQAMYVIRAARYPVNDASTSSFNNPTEVRT